MFRDKNSSESLLTLHGILNLIRDYREGRDFKFKTRYIRTEFLMVDFPISS